MVWWRRRRYCKRMGQHCCGQPAPGPAYRFANTLLQVSGEKFLQAPEALQTEAFGPVALLVMTRDTAQTVAILKQLEGNLTGTIYSDTTGKDDADYAVLELLLRQRVGRLINDKMPTGVAVSPAMNHGGPFPATMGTSGLHSSGHPGEHPTFHLRCIVTTMCDRGDCRLGCRVKKSLLLQTTELRRRQVGHRSERPRERTVIIEAAVECNLRHRPIRFAQQM